MYDVTYFFLYFVFCNLNFRFSKDNLFWISCISTGLVLLTSTVYRRVYPLHKQPKIRPILWFVRHSAFTYIRSRKCPILTTSVNKALLAAESIAEILATTLWFECLEWSTVMTEEYSFSGAELRRESSHSGLTSLNQPCQQLGNMPALCKNIAGGCTKCN